MNAMPLTVNTGRLRPSGANAQPEQATLDEAKAALDEAKAALDAPQAIAWLLHWTQAGVLRHLDSALAMQMQRLDPHASPGLLVACAVLAHMEGRGHTCLALADVCAPPLALLGWATAAGAQPGAAQQAGRDLAALWAQLPCSLDGWRAALAGPCVRPLHAPDAGQPLVLGGPAHAPLLYLRRYAGHEQRVGQSVLQRATQPVALSPSAKATARQWLAHLFAPKAAVLAAALTSHSAPESLANSVPLPAALPVPDEHTFDWQQMACAVALRAGLTVITGGPGTGKTYTAARLLTLLLALHEGPNPLRVALAAPTGKAAARLKQSIDQALQALVLPPGADLDVQGCVARMGPARTLHALLGARTGTRQMRHHKGHVLDVDVLIVDEASMVHLDMMDALLQALAPTARLVLLGDKDQLASVEAGAVLGDVCQDAQRGQYSAQTVDFVREWTGQALPAAFVWQPEAAQPLAHSDAPQPSLREPALAQQTVMLRHSRRFEGAIGELAHAVNSGHAARARACMQSPQAGAGDCPLWAQHPDHPSAVCALALGHTGKPSYVDYLQLLAQGPLPQAQGGPQAHGDWVRGVLRALDRFRILCAVHQGEWGREAINAAVQAALAAQGWLKPQGEWFAGRPIMVTRNDAQLGVFNGDVGLVLPSEQGALKAWFADGDALRSVGVMRLAHVQTAFAMTVHKSQGSEFEHTALVLPPGAGVARELLYTGLTRSRKQFSLIEAQAGLLEAAVARPSVRASGLSQWFEPGVLRLP